MARSTARSLELTLAAPGGLQEAHAERWSAPARRNARALRVAAGSLPDVDLVALLLGTARGGEEPLAAARALLHHVGDAAGLQRTSAQEIAELPGVGAARALRVCAALELGRRSLLRSLSEQRRVVGSFDAVVEWARPRLATLDHEEVWMLAVDGRNGVRAERRIAQGGLHGCALTPKDVLRPALKDAASGIVLIHNHPSGDPEPSPDDVRMTRAMAAACDVVGVALLDHVIVARGGSSSLLDLGVLGAPARAHDAGSRA